MKSRGESKPKWVRVDDELQEAVDDEQIILQRQTPGAKISFSIAFRNLAMRGARCRCQQRSVVR
jgi:hypothetical protein